MIERKTAESLISLLSNEKEQLKNIYKMFSMSIDINSKFFCFTGLSFLLQSNCLLPKQQIVALWILSRESKNTSLQSNPYVYVYKLMLDSNETLPIIQQIIISILTNNSIIDSLANKSTNQILNPKFTLSKTSLSLDKETIEFLASYKTQKTIIPSFFFTENPENFENEKIMTTTNDDILIWLLTSNYLFEEPKYGPELEIPPLFDVTKQELDFTAIQAMDIEPLFDDAKRSMIYEPIESIINRMENDVLKKREIKLVLNAVQKDPTLVNFMFDESDEAVSKTLHIIDTNRSAARNLYCYFASTDARIFDMMLNFEITENSMSILESVILQGNFPSNFVESFIDIVLEKLRKSKDPSSDKMVGMIYKVHFSDYVACEFNLIFFQ